MKPFNKWVMDALKDAKTPAQLHALAWVTTRPEARDAEPETSDTEILAWRGWYLGTSNGPALMSMSHGTTWTGPVLVADKLPTAANGHGIYAVKGKQAWLRSPYHATCMAYGQVALSGKVCEHQDGYRGERAVIRSLYLKPPTDPRALLACRDRQALADKLAERYGVDVLLDPWEPVAKQQFEEMVEAIANKAEILQELAKAAQKACAAMGNASLAFAFTEDLVSTGRTLIVGRIGRVKVSQDASSLFYGIPPTGIPPTHCDRLHWAIDGNIDEIVQLDT